MPAPGDLRALVAGGLSAAAVAIAAPYAIPEVVRPDPFLGADAEKLRAELSETFELELRLLRAELRLQLPPEPTRLRIQALEDAVRELQPTFRPPTSRFSRWGGPDP